MLAGASGVPDPATRTAFVQGAAAPVDLQIGPAGDLFYVDFTGGNIHRVRYVEGMAPQAVINASPTAGATPLTVTFDGSGSQDSDGTTLSFAWDLDGDGTFGDASVPRTTYTYGAAGSYRPSLKVTDADGLSSVAAVTISAGNSAPTAVIDTPSAPPRWRVGQSIAFSGHAVDAQQATLPASRLTWLLIMNHCSTATSCHEHQIQEFQGVAAGSFVAPDHEYPSYLTLRLAATDAGGLEGATTLRLDPEAVTIGLQSVPAGLQLGFGSKSVVTPLPSELVIVGSTFSLSAPSPQVLQGTAYEFVSWSDRGAQTHIVVAGASPVTYTAFFQPARSTDLDTRVLFVAHATARAGTWRVVADSTAAGGARLEHPDAGVAKITTAATNPRDYFELTFHAEGNRAYRLWFRGQAAENAYTNDSAFAQFSSTVDAAGSAIYRIGTSSATPLSVEACSGCGLAGWGWEDNGYGGSGPLIRFASTGVQTVRIQGREDGVSIDQIVLSPVSYVVYAPGPPKDDSTILTEHTGLSSDIVLHAAVGATVNGKWNLIADLSAASGVRMENPDLGAAKLTAALAVPADYFDLTFNAEAGRPYRLWLRARALSDDYQNDSVFVQFAGTVDAAGVPVFRIGTTDAAKVVLEDCGGCALSQWGWQDNGYGSGVLGATIRFATGGLQRIRIQRREDGITIDQIVLSPATYLTAAPGAVRNDVVILPRSQ